MLTECLFTQSAYFYQVYNMINTGGMILGEIGYIHRFFTPNKLSAFAGLDSSVYQPDNLQAKTIQLSKRGSRVLRYALVNAT